MGLSENRVPQKSRSLQLIIISPFKHSHEIGHRPHFFGQTQIIKTTSLPKKMVFYQMFRFSWIIRTSYHFLQQKTKVDQKQSGKTSGQGQSARSHGDLKTRGPQRRDLQTLNLSCRKESP